MPRLSVLKSLAGAAVALALTAGTAMAEFRGGGSLFAFTETCAQHGWPVNSVVPVRVRHAPSELYGFPTQVTIAMPTSTQHIAVWQPLNPTGTVFQALGRQLNTFFTLYPNNPQVSSVQRRITARVNAGQPETVANAREMFLRIRISGFGNLPGCGVTLAAQLRRF